MTRLGSGSLPGADGAGAPGMVCAADGVGDAASAADDVAGAAAACADRDEGISNVHVSAAALAYINGNVRATDAPFAEREVGTCCWKASWPVVVRRTTGPADEFLSKDHSASMDLR